MSKINLDLTSNSKHQLSLYLFRDYLKTGAYVNIRDHKKFTPLHCAALIGSVEIGDILLKNHADLYARDD